MAGSGRRQCAHQRNAGEPDGDSGSGSCDFQALPSESGRPLSAARPQGPAPFHATVALFRVWLLLHGNSRSIPLAAAAWLPMLRVLATPPVTVGRCPLSAATWPARSASSWAFKIRLKRRQFPRRHSPVAQGPTILGWYLSAVKPPPAPRGRPQTPSRSTSLSLRVPPAASRRRCHSDWHCHRFSIFRSASKRGLSAGDGAGRFHPSRRDSEASPRPRGPRPPANVL